MIPHSKENTVQEISIELGLESDIGQIKSLQTYWLGKTQENKNGFLFGAQYTTSELKRIIANNNLIIAKVKNEFAGFFLVDADSGNELTKAYQVQLKKNLPDFNNTSCPRAQIAIKPEYFRLGISKLLTRYLACKLIGRYDSVYSLVSKQNSNLPKHLKNGWKIVHVNSEMYYVKLDIKAMHYGKLQSKSYEYRRLTDREIEFFKPQILKLIEIYYENPQEIFEMIYPGRIFFTAFKDEKLIGLYTVKHNHLNSESLLAYLGLLLLHPDHRRVLSNLVSAHTVSLEEHLNKNIYIYSLTSNPSVHKIARKFYHNIYPRNLYEKEMEIPEFYDSIVSHTGYNLCVDNFYKVINSPSVARYNQEFKRKLSEIPASKNSLCQSYNLNTENGDRVLIIGTYNNQNP